MKKQEVRPRVPDRAKSTASKEDLLYGSDNSLQADVFEWDGDDEERFAMEKVHGFNDFADDEQTKFNSMDEANGFGDDDWRALASETQAEAEQSGMEDPKEGSDNAGLYPTEPQIEGNDIKAVNQAVELDPDVQAFGNEQLGGGEFMQPQVDDQRQGTMFITEIPNENGGPNIRIMRFTRKRTSNNRGRRKDAAHLLVKPKDLLEKFAVSKEAQQQQPTVNFMKPPKEAQQHQSAFSFMNSLKEAQQQQPTVNVVKSEFEAPAAQEASIPSVKMVEVDSNPTRDKVVETKCVLVRASSYDDLEETGSIQVKQLANERTLQFDPEKKRLKKVEGRLEKRITRPKQQKMAEDQQNKKPKALAFQKSRNIINKRINAESVKPEPTMDIDCVEAAAMQEKYMDVTAECRALQEEIHPLIAGEEEEVPAGVQERWMDSSCKLLRTKFDLHFGVVQHFLCHQPQQCSRVS